MAEIVLGIGTSHTPLLSLDPALWETYAQGDRKNPELAYPPNGWVLPFEEGQQYVSPEIKGRYDGEAPYADQYRRCQASLDTLAETLQAAQADITLVISDDQDEWFYDDCMPRFAVYWGETAPMVPGKYGDRFHPAVAAAMTAGYGDIPLDVPVPSNFGRHLVEYLGEHDFDVANLTYARPTSGGRVARRYPTPDGELQYARDTTPRPQGLPHGFSFVVKRLYNNQPRPLLPVFQNTCYPPNQPSPRRSFAFGRAIGEAVRAWDSPARVAVVASGGLSHFVVDEEVDRAVLTGLKEKDTGALQGIQRHRLFSATSETLNWIALGGALHDTPLDMELLDYVPVYRTPAGTGGGWAFARWQ